MSVSRDATPKIGVFYEHPEWFAPLFAELERRGVAFERLPAFEHSFDPAERSSPYTLVLNRMSPSAFLRGHAHTIPYTLHYLAHLKAMGANVIGSYDAYRYEFSKAKQIGLLARLGVKHPRTRVVNHVSAAAAEGLSFPVVVKPNIGGSGAGIRRFDTSAELKAAALTGKIDLGPDGTALVQEYLPPQDASIVRVEVLNGEFLYAIRLRLESPDSFNLCPADYCKPGQSTLERAVESYTPPAEVIAAVKRITKVADIEVGGVEYLVSERDGELYYYDINALSNFVADAPNIIGFDPFEPLVDFVLERARLMAV